MYIVIKCCWNSNIVYKKKVELTRHLLLSLSWQHQLYCCQPADAGGTEVWLISLATWPWRFLSTLFQQTWIWHRRNQSYFHQYLQLELLDPYSHKTHPRFYRLLRVEAELCVQQVYLHTDVIKVIRIFCWQWLYTIKSSIKLASVCNFKSI